MAALWAGMKAAATAEMRADWWVGAMVDTKVEK